MYLFNRIKELLSLPNSIVMEETNKKLVGTWCVFNGRLGYFHEFVDPRMNCARVTFFKEAKESAILVEKFDLFLPEAGLYLGSNGVPILVTKKPVKQWHKSYSDKYYNCNATYPNKNLSVSYLEDIFLGKRQDIVKDGFNKVWYLDNIIGFVDDKGVVCCTNTLFKQELIDWSKYANT